MGPAYPLHVTRPPHLAPACASLPLAQASLPSCVAMHRGLPALLLWDPYQQLLPHHHSQVVVVSDEPLRSWMAVSLHSSGVYRLALGEGLACAIRNSVGRPVSWSGP